MIISVWDFRVWQKEENHLLMRDNSTLPDGTYQSTPSAGTELFSMTE